MAWNEISKTKQPLLIFFIPAVLFSIILLAFYPTYHSADDNYFLYEMSGANGNGATNLLQYDYGMHPYLIYPVKFMFGIFPGVNWYSLLLYCLHLLSWVIIFKAFFDRFALWDAIFIGTVLFFVFGAQFLLRVTYTNTSAVTAIAALTHLMSTVSAKAKVDRVDGIMSAILLITAGLLRVHVIIPFAGLCLVFFAAYPARKFLPVVFAYATVIAGLFVLNLIQKDFYRAHITDWDQKNEYRAAVLSYDNHSKLPDSLHFNAKQRLQSQWLLNGILVDTQFLTTSDIYKIVESKEGAREFATLKAELYWLVVNSRLMVLTAIAILLFGVFLLRKEKLKKFLAIAQGLLLIAGCWLLLVYAKLPYYLPPLLLFFYSLCCLFLFAGGKVKTIQYVRSASIGLGLICIGWGTVRLYKENKKNIAGHQAFVNAWREISANADKLFIAPYFSIPFDDIGVFESPFRYPLPNVVFKNSLMNHAHEKAYARFGIQSAADLYRSDKVRFVGPTVPLIQQYYRLQTGQSVSVVPPPEKYRYLMVTQLSLTQGY